MRPAELILLIDDRYHNVYAVGDAVRTVLPLEFEARHSDYLGGDYLAHKGKSYDVKIQKNYSSFLEEWCVEGEIGAAYVMIVTGGCDPRVFDAVAALPGFRLYADIAAR